MGSFEFSKLPGVACLIVITIMSIINKQIMKDNHGGSLRDGTAGPCIVGHVTQ